MAAMHETKVESLIRFGSTELTHSYLSRHISLDDAWCALDDSTNTHAPAPGDWPAPQHVLESNLAWRLWQLLEDFHAWHTDERDRFIRTLRTLAERLRTERLRRKQP